MPKKKNKNQKTKKTKINPPVRKNKLLIYLLFPAIIIIAAIFLLNKPAEPDEDANKLLELLSSSESQYSIMDDQVDHDSVDVEKLKNIDIDQLKKENGIKSNVAIYFERNDQIKEVEGMTCIGSPKIELNGQPCDGQH